MSEKHPLVTYRYMKQIFTSLVVVALLMTLLSCDPAAASTQAVQEEEGLELPAINPDEDIYRYTGFTSSYNHTTLVPNWVAYELTADELDGGYSTRSSSFSRDPKVRGRQASREDYSRSGWDKGHMAPKADLRWSETAYWESHYFTNVCPQNHEMNARDWGTLEKAVRSWARRYGKVWVVCGPIFNELKYGTIGAAKVHVPDAFFKAVLVCAHGEWNAIAYVMPNEPYHHPMASYACTVDDLEELIGRDLFVALDDKVETVVESTINDQCWR